MAAPDSSLVGAPPHIGVDEDATAVLAKHGCLHSNSLKDEAEITRYIDDLILNLVLVDPVVRNGLEPLLSWHHDSRWLEEHKDVVGVQELLNAGDIAAARCRTAIPQPWPAEPPRCRDRVSR